jgi:hypothetical protein
LGDCHILSEILRWQQQENIVAMHNSWKYFSEYWRNALIGAYFSNDEKLWREKLCQRLSI